MRSRGGVQDRASRPRSRPSGLSCRARPVVVPWVGLVRMPRSDSALAARLRHRERTLQYLTELHASAARIVEREYRRPLTLAMVARELATSPRQIQRAYAQVGDMGFGAHLRAVRLRNAAELLAHQPLTVTDVARLVGYRQQSHFVKAFRGAYEVTPGAFRDLSRQRAEHRAADATSGPRSAATPPRPDGPHDHRLARRPSAVAASRDT
jgi:AraC-like DNA-binding protein